MLVAVCLAAVLAFVAIVLDGGGLQERRRHAQAAADAAALAAAEDLFRNYPKNKGTDPSGTAADRALAIASANGFSGDGALSVVNVRVSPQAYLGGPHAGTALPRGYTEVSVQYNQPRFFSAILGSGSIPVPARAVARGSWEPSYVGIHVLDLHRSGSLNATGESFATVTGASVIVNSDAPDAAITNGGTITASPINITGNSSSVGSKGGFVGELNYGTPPEPDPLRHIPEPTANGQTVQSNGPLHLSNGHRTLAPGTYRGGISVSGKGSLTLLPGVYYMDGGGFAFSGQGDLAAQGVMIFNAPSGPSHKVDISGTGSIAMSPPTDGIYKGLTLFQDRESANELSVSGGGYMDIAGTFYAANATLKVAGGGDSKVGSQYISRFLEIVGNGGLRIDYDPNQAIPRRILQLIE
ncbi:MAG: pilus assembly protein TadG-related protein [Pirellulaceae bacterium]